MTDHSRPMLFSGPMVRALLSGTKTQTRRIIRVPEFVVEASDGSPHWRPQRCGAGWEFIEWSTDYGRAHPLRCPYGQPGDRLWVRETWMAESTATGPHQARFAATDAPYFVGAKWRPSIHMPRWASRITLEITDVRVGLLNEISEVDAKAEGLTARSKDGTLIKYGIPDRDGLPGDDDLGWHWQEWNRDPCVAFRRLWEKTNGSGSWDTNPWVWVLTFKRAEK